MRNRDMLILAAIIGGAVLLTRKKTLAEKGGSDAKITDAGPIPQGEGAKLLPLVKP